MTIKDLSFVTSLASTLSLYIEWLALFIHKVAIIALSSNTYIVKL